MKTEIKTAQDKIDYIMDNFDFNKVEKTMRALDWKWCGAESDDSIPIQSDLRKQARRLLKQASAKVVSEDDFRYCVSTGGFRAIKYYDGNISLEFIVTEWETYTD